MGPGTQLGKFVLTRRLGMGGMGEVWAAMDQGAARRRVALKLIRQDPGHALLSHLLVDEARAMVGLPLHANLVTLFDVLEMPGLIALVMELVEGPTLREHLLLHPTGLPWREAFPIMKGLFEGLLHAHSHHLIHRDLKPENVKIRLAQEGQSPGPEDVKILDFGLARQEEGFASTVGEVGGTLAYMSPEQFLGRHQGPAVDQYALAVMLFELVTGQQPFRPSPRTLEGFRKCHLEEAPPPLLGHRPDAPIGFQVALHRALAKDPTLRFPDLQTFQEAILPSLAHLAQWTGDRWEGDAADVSVPSLLGVATQGPPPAAGPSHPAIPGSAEGPGQASESHTSLLVLAPEVAPDGAMALLESISDALLGEGDVEDLLSRALEGLGRHLQASGGVVLAKEGEAPLRTLCAWGSSKEAEVPFSRSLLRAVLEERQALVIQPGDLALPAAPDSFKARGLRTALVAPMLTEGVILGLLYIDGQEGTPPFGGRELQLTRALANLGAARIMRARLEQAAESRKRLEREMVLARQIQAQWIPEHLPAPDGFEAHGSLESCLLVSGDGYGGWMTPLGCRYALGDVAGKGVGPGLLMAGFLSWLEASSQLSAPPAELAEAISEGLAKRTSPKHYLTAVILDVTGEGVLRLCNAGHVTPLRFRSDGTCDRIDSHGLPLAMLPGGSYDTYETHLEPGDLLLLVTDGLTEAESTEGEFFGLERLVDLTTRHRNAPLPLLDRLIRSEVYRHAAEVPRADDQTLLMLRRQ